MTCASAAAPATGRPRSMPWQRSPSRTPLWEPALGARLPTATKNISGREPGGLHASAECRLSRGGTTTRRAGPLRHCCRHRLPGASARSSAGRAARRVLGDSGRLPSRRLHVVLHRVGSDMEAIRNLPGRQAVHDEPSHLLFAIGQPMRLSAVPVAVRRRCVMWCASRGLGRHRSCCGRRLVPESAQRLNTSRG